MCRLTRWRQFFTPCWTSQKRKADQRLGLDRAALQKAGLELRQAYQVLSEAEDADMVDYAVFTLQAAEKRYGYLIKKLKEEEKQNKSRDDEKSERPVTVHYVEG